MFSQEDFLVNRNLLIAAILIACIFNSIGNAEEKQARAGVNYLFSYFKDNGQDGLHLAYSHDGLKWTALKNDRSFLKPQVAGMLMRDPCICRGPDATFHMVWTSSWREKGIGIAHSKDLIKWSEQKYIPVMEHEPTAMNCWAPEIFYDSTSKKYLIYWSTTIPGRFAGTENTGDRDREKQLNHRIYCVTTKDFQTYSRAKLFYNDGFNVIDATIIKDGDRYVMFLKDETKEPVAKKNIRIAYSDKLEGPYGHASDPISPDWVEGPTALKINDYWYLYYDGYTRHRYEGLRSKDFKNWESITDKLSFPPGTRHGTAFIVEDEILTKLLELK